MTRFSGTRCSTLVPEARKRTVTNRTTVTAKLNDDNKGAAAAANIAEAGKANTQPHQQYRTTCTPGSTSKERAIGTS